VDTTIKDFDPNTGTSATRGTAGTVTGAQAFASAAAAIAFAVSGGDDRRVSDFGRPDFKGLVNASLT
jgi:hypothetical protein